MFQFVKTSGLLKLYKILRMDKKGRDMVIVMFVFQVEKGSVVLAGFVYELCTG